VGLPGSGKTTLARGLLARLAGQRLACGDRDLIGRLGNSRAAHYARLARFTLGRGRYLPATFRLAAAVSPPTAARIRFAAKLAVWPYRLSVARARGFETVVLDQGILQSAWCVLLEGSLRRESVLQEAVAELLSGCAASFAFISLDLDATLAAARIQARGPMDAPFNRSNPETVHLLAEHREHLEQVVAAGVRASGAPHLRLDASRPVSENAARIDTFVDAVLGSPVC
jgi:AAA domain-containing protein